MLVNLDKVASILVVGGKVQVHFQDTSLHMRRFRTRRELDTILDGWHNRDAGVAELTRGG